MQSVFKTSLQIRNLKSKTMNRKLKYQDRFNQWKSDTKRHNMQILTVNLAVIIAVFVCAYILQP